MATNPFFEHPILYSPYEYPTRYWELDEDGQPTQKIIERRRRAEFITPIPKPKKRKGSTDQQQIIFDEGKGLSTKGQQYDPTSIINELRQQVDQWRSLPLPSDTERHLLYVACTRARDFLLVTATEPASEFLDDLRA